jgi:hypothetical protein
MIPPDPRLAALELARAARPAPEPMTRPEMAALDLRAATGRYVGALDAEAWDESLGAAAGDLVDDIRERCERLMAELGRELGI